MPVTIEYRTVRLNEMHVRPIHDQKPRRLEPQPVDIGGELFQTSGRFWTSLYARYGFAQSLFKYFSHEEVFARVVRVNSRDRLRLCVDRDGAGNGGRLLAVSAPTRAVVRYDALQELLRHQEGQAVSYHDGIVESQHLPRCGSNRFTVAGDAFVNRFVLRCPIDAFGAPHLFLALWREVCTNGAIALHRAFRSDLAVGRGTDNVTFTLSRAIDSFHNDEGFAALRQRFESAATSWGSVQEAISLYNALVRSIGAERLRTDGASLPVRRPNSSILDRFHRLTGDVSQLYGMANFDAISTKRQRTLPVNCKVYDLLNFATEVGTHHVGDQGKLRLNAWVGTLVSSEFDLEGTAEADRITDFRDFFMEPQVRQVLDDSARRH